MVWTVLGFFQRGFRWLLTGLLFQIDPARIDFKEYNHNVLCGTEESTVPFIASWTELDTGVFVLPETALGSYSLGLKCVESASEECLVRAI